MNEQEYMKMLYVIDDYYEGDPIIIQWSNGLKVKCKSTSGVFENDAEPEDDDYVGEYSIGVSEVEILKNGTDNSVEICDNSIEICIWNIPEKITKEDGTVLWERKE